MLKDWTTEWISNNFPEKIQGKYNFGQSHKAQKIRASPSFSLEIYFLKKAIVTLTTRVAELLTQSLKSRERNLLQRINALLFSETILAT